MYWLSYFSFSTFNKTKRGFQILGTLNCRLKWNILVVFFRLWSQTSRWRWWSLWRPYSPTSGGCRLLNLTNSRRRTSCPCWINSFCRSQSVPFLQSVTYVIWYIWFNDIPLIYHTVLDDVYWDLKNMRLCLSFGWTISECVILKMSQKRHTLWTRVFFTITVLHFY